MFTAKPIQDKKEQEALCARLGAEYSPRDMAYAVDIDGKEAGIVTMCINGKKGCLRQIRFYKEAEDFEVMFICGRSAMEFLDRVGAHEGYFLMPDPQNERLTKALGYKKQEDGSWYLNTEGFFVDHCKNHEEKL